jgi:hypothetical protein
VHSKAMLRAVRSARAVLHGAQILKIMQDPKTRRRLVSAAESGAPPVTAVSAQLEEILGAKDARLQPVKQFAGICIRAVLEEEGFEVSAKGVRLSNDPIFRTGSTYERRANGKAAKETLLVRFISSLSADEVEEALRMLRRRRQA